MTGWPWLMIVVLANAVQWHSSNAKQTNNYSSYWSKYLNAPRGNNHRSKRWGISVRQTDAALNTTLKSFTTENLQKIQPRPDVRSTNERTLSTPILTKSLNLEYSNNYYNHIQLDDKRKPLSKSSSTNVVFPTSEEKKPIIRFPVNTFIPEPRVIEKCTTNTSFCIKVDNYPRQDILRILKNSKYASDEFFAIDTKVEDKVQPRGFDDFQPMCNTKEDVIFPQAGFTQNKEWRYIIQDENDKNSNFSQGIRIETCTDNQVCKFNELLPLGYTTTCVQNYMYKKLVAIKDSKEVYRESFKFPSCCSCMVSVSPTELFRLGEEPKNQRLFENQTEPKNKLFSKSLNIKK